METEQYLAAAENRYRQKLESFISGIFGDCFLPSHGPEHHRRVWLYARELAFYGNVLPDELSATKLLIACYLHDSGMAYERGEKHGARSMELCREFLQNNNLSPADYADVLGAIENHDNKNYPQISNPSPLKSILGIADDLDALGFTGIYRYLEIYAERGIPFRELGSRILGNVAARFERFTEVFGGYPEIYNRHSQRYEIIRDFCENYIRESEVYNFGQGKPEGYCGVAEIISGLVRKELPVTEAGSYLTDLRVKDTLIHMFFSELQNELSS